MTRPALRVLEKRRGLVTFHLDFECPNHPSADLLMRCPRCRRTFEEHTARIAALPPVRKP